MEAECGVWVKAAVNEEIPTPLRSTFDMRGLTRLVGASPLDGRVRRHGSSAPTGLGKPDTRG